MTEPGIACDDIGGGVVEIDLHDVSPCCPAE